MKPNLLIFWAVLPFFLGVLSCSSASGDEDFSDREWREYLGGPDRNHYSVLDQINTDNVHQLEVAWTYHTLDTGQMQSNHCKWGFVRNDGFRPAFCPQCSNRGGLLEQSNGGG